ncbi:diguanylate cyclase [Cryobacterium sp. SO2]|uniref:diguanylate cyclase n=1 Tax=Cryobacterium sp. SO2 TaxID=1897060 RepID=UPI00223D4C40|nr:diguanylate cyclase [Cryobacterium sp. SO2]WEO76331.1 diguanylate cyclase [Cryobacterium sp. SO2]
MTPSGDLVPPLPAGTTVPADTSTHAQEISGATPGTSAAGAAAGVTDTDAALPGGFVERGDLPQPADQADLPTPAEPETQADLPNPAASAPADAGHRMPPPRDTAIDALLDSSAQANRDGQHHIGVAQAEHALADPHVTAAQEARAWQLLSGHWLRLGEFEASVRHGLLALDYFTGTGDLLAQSTVHCTLALAFHETALEEPALSHVLGALEAARACGSVTAEFWALSRSSMVHQALGEAERSIQLGRQAIALADTLDDPEAGFAAVNNLGDAFLEIARAQRTAGEDASEALRDGLALTRAAVARALEQRHAFYETVARTNLVGFLIELGQYAEARSQAGRSKTIATANNYQNLAVNNDAQLAEVARAEGRIDLACAMMDAQLADPSVSEDAALKVKLHRELYEMHSNAGRFEQALRHHEELHVLMLGLTRQTAGLQSRMLINSLEIEQARHEAQRSQLEAEMQRIRAEELDEQANTDPLTRLPNRRALDRQLPEMMSTALDRSEPLCAVMIDMDHFKEVNDQHGHAAGDRVLTTMAAILGETTRATDLAVRVGGEEFLLVLGNTNLDQAVQICERLLGEVRSHPWSTVTAGLSCTASVGVALLTRGESVSRWLGRADAALYEAKSGGRNRVELAPTRA